MQLFPTEHWFVKRQPFTPLKIFAFLTIVLAVAIVAITGGWGIILGFYIIVAGFLLYLIDHMITRFCKDKKTFWSLQLTLAIIYLFCCSWTYIKWQEHNLIVFPDHFKGEAGIVFGMKGYPPLPATEWGKKTIDMPESGIIITSTKAEDVPNTVRYAFQSGQQADASNIDWNPNFEYSCIINNSVIKAWLFTVGNRPTLQVREKITALANQIIAGKAQSVYSSTNAALANDNKGTYLWLQDRDLNFLPDTIAKLKIYKAILTGNHFREIPPQILANEALEDLMIGHNPLAEITPAIYKLKRLKSLTVNATKIKDIKTDLSKLDSLTDFDFSANEATALPEQVKHLPKLTWLELNDNKFKDLSFVDERLNKLETLYLYTNEIKQLSPNIKHLSNLKQLLIFDNQIDTIPDEIGALVNLEKLEIWNNPIKFISPAISKLQKLKEMRIDDDNLSDEDKKHLKEWLPHCTINFQTRKEK